MSTAMNLETRTQFWLIKLMGLQLSTVHFAGNMPMFGFGTTHREGKRLIAAYSLHVSCAWRLENRNVIVTGDGDWDLDDMPGGSGSRPPNENRQSGLLAEILKGRDDVSRGLVNTTDALVVTAVQADTFGGCTVTLSPDYRLVLFPSTARYEAWRLLDMGRHDEQIVVGGSETHLP
jgi:hypothetical protein